MLIIAAENKRPAPAQARKPPAELVQRHTEDSAYYDYRARAQRRGVHPRAIRNLLDLDYPQLEIIVFNDGSKDRTLEEMRDEFRLRAVRAVYVAEVKGARVRGLYRSDVDSRLLVVDKDAGGCRAFGSTCAATMNGSR